MRLVAFLHPDGVIDADKALVSQLDVLIAVKEASSRRVEILLNDITPVLALLRVALREDVLDVQCNNLLKADDDDVR